MSAMFVSNSGLTNRTGAPLTRRSTGEAPFGGDLSPQERGEVLSTLPRATRAVERDGRAVLALAPLLRGEGGRRAQATPE